MVNGQWLADQLRMLGSEDAEGLSSVSLKRYIRDQNLDGLWNALRIRE